MQPELGRFFLSEQQERDLNQVEAFFLCFFFFFFFFLAKHIFKWQHGRLVCGGVNINMFIPSKYMRRMFHV